MQATDTHNRLTSILPPDARPVCDALRFDSMAHARDVIARIQALIDSPVGSDFLQGPLEAGIYAGAFSPYPLLYFTRGAIALAQRGKVPLPRAEGALRLDRRGQTTLLVVPPRLDVRRPGT